MALLHAYILSLFFFFFCWSLVFLILKFYGGMPFISLPMVWEELTSLYIRQEPSLISATLLLIHLRLM